MNIFIKLKFVFSILLLCCLFLPLSQCTSYTKPEAEKPSKAVVQKQYAFESVEKIESWLSAIALIAPFFVLLLTYQSNHKVKSSIAIFVLSCAALYSIANATFFAEKLLIGGYLGYLSSVGLMVVILIEMLLNFRLYLKSKNA